MYFIFHVCILQISGRRGMDIESNSEEVMSSQKIEILRISPMNQAVFRSLKKIMDLFINSSAKIMRRFTLLLLIKNICRTMPMQIWLRFNS